MPRLKTARLAVVLAATSAATTTTMAANAYTIGRCAEQGEAVIDRLGIDRAKISLVRTDILRAGRPASMVSGIDLWIGSPACQGSVVLAFTQDCTYTGSFTRGDCTLADIQR